AHKAIAQGKLVPVVCVSSKKDQGLQELLNLLASCSLDPSDVHKMAIRDDDDEVDIDPKEEGEVIAQVFKTTNDLIIGKLSYDRSHYGQLTSEVTLTNLLTGKAAKPGHFYQLQGKTQEEVKEAIAGDIVAIAKWDDLHISDTVVSARAQNASHL